jgi:NAD(P)-dependent dehydrogenase (short-subunit alcohol dehydrogenase family)
LVSKQVAIDVKGLRVLVTADGSGIGRAIAQSFSASGARVHVTDILEPALTAALRDAQSFSATLGDVSQPADAERALADVERLGGLDVLINNAGIAGPTGSIDETDEGDVNRTIDVNLKSQFYFLKRSMPLLRESRRNPSILAMSSVAGRLGYGYRTP